MSVLLESSEFGAKVKILESLITLDGQEAMEAKKAAIWNSF